ncbi:hypothetical protein M5K25_000030 [Dendrobium thyrsiflorum]|uniref:Uncharacterized protein n=1 Tax=Dendrobium thyrsiflorum TaxID=117978 RepID=A0ABD0W5W8_DENTH
MALANLNMCAAPHHFAPLTSMALVLDKGLCAWLDSSSGRLAIPTGAAAYVRKICSFFQKFGTCGFRAEIFESTKLWIEVTAKKVDALEERLEGEMNQIKTTVEESISSMEGQVADLRDMMKKILEIHNQTAASVAKGVEGKNTNSKNRREDDEVEIVDGERRKPYLEPFQREDRGGGRYGERHGYGGMEQRGADWECRVGSYSRRAASRDLGEIDPPLE